MNSRRGITFVEAVIGILIATTMATAIIGFYVHAHKMETHGSQALDSLQDAQQLLAYLLDDLQALAPEDVTKPKSWITFKDVDDDEKYELIFQRWTDLEESTGEAERMTVTYEVNPSFDGKSKGPSDYYLHRSTEISGTTWKLARGGLRDFEAKAKFSYWTIIDGEKVYRDGTHIPPHNPKDIKRFWISVSLKIQQFNKTGQPTTQLPLTIEVFPRQFCKTIHSRWIGTD